MWKFVFIIWIYDDVAMSFQNSGIGVNYLGDIIIVINFTICCSLITLTSKSKESKFLVLKHKDDVVHVVEQEVIWPRLEIIFHKRQWVDLHIKLTIVNWVKSYDPPFVS